MHHANATQNWWHSSKRALLGIPVCCWGFLPPKPNSNGIPTALSSTHRALLKRKKPSSSAHTHTTHPSYSKSWCSRKKWGKNIITFEKKKYFQSFNRWWNSFRVGFARHMPMNKLGTWPAELIAQFFTLHAEWTQFIAKLTSFGHFWGHLVSLRNTIAGASACLRNQKKDIFHARRECIGCWTSRGCQIHTYYTHACI